MSDLMYASIVIVIIWAGIFLWVFRLDRRLRNIENSLPGRLKPTAQSETESDQETETTTD